MSRTCRSLAAFAPIAAALFVLVLPRARAADRDGGSLETRVTLPPLVVTSGDDGRLRMDAPYAADVLDAEALRRERIVRTVPEALKHEPGVMVQKTGHGQGSPYIRGFTGYRDLLLIDGVRLNNSVFRDGPNQYWNTVDALNLRRIELIRGPASMLYGSDAVGGVVNAVTRGAQDLRPGSNWDRRLYYRFASAENSHMSRAESIGRLSDTLTLSAGFSFKDFGDLEGGRSVGTQEKTGYDERDWDAKLEYFPDDDAVLVLAHQGVIIDDACPSRSRTSPTRTTASTARASTNPAATSSSPPTSSSSV